VNRWQACLDALQASGRLPSVAAGVLQGGELVWSGGEIATSYRIGSITKTMTAAAILQLRDDGLLSLDDPIGSFVPESGYAGATVRALLTHTSGMQSEPVGSWWERSPGVDAAALLVANDGSGAVAQAGDYFHYSNLGFALLGEATARLRDATWWEVVSQRLLGPLGMRHTTCAAPAEAAQGYSVDHFAGTLTHEPHHDTGAMAPAGQLWSTVGDLARWAAFLASGHLGVLGAETLLEASRPSPPAADYGLGLRLLDVDGRRMVGHTGSMPGFLASLFVDPDTGDGVVLLTNATTGLDADAVPALFLGDGPVPSADPWVPTSSVPTVAEPLLGLWFWGNSAIEARWHNGSLHLRSLALGKLSDIFEVRDDGLVGAWGYHRGETLHVVHRADGSLSHLECATFVYTRTPYARTHSR